jgi:hypothetical protein
VIVRRVSSELGHREGDERAHIFAFETHQAVGRAHSLNNSQTFVDIVREGRVVVVHVGEEDVRVDRRLGEEDLQ